MNRHADEVMRDYLLPVSISAVFTWCLIRKWLIIELVVLWYASLTEHSLTAHSFCLFCLIGSNYIYYTYIGYTVYMFFFQVLDLLNKNKYSSTKSSKTFVVAFSVFWLNIYIYFIYIYWFYSVHIFCFLAILQCREVIAENTHQ